VRLWPMLALPACLLTLGSEVLSGERSELDGRYILAQRTVVVAEIPILPDLSTETWSVSLVDLTAKAEPSGEQLQGRGRLCHIEMRSSSSLVRTELPSALQRLLGDVEVQARLIRHPGGLRLRQAPRWLVLGAKLRDPEHDPLPESAADPRVFDHDGDGKPGVTVRVRGIVNGEVQVVQRGASALHGERDAHGFHGAVHFRTEDVVIGATKAALRKRTKTHPDPSRSTFVLRKVRADLDCAEAVAAARRLH
jgi:hypothetical protein